MPGYNQVHILFRMIRREILRPGYYSRSRSMGVYVGEALAWLDSRIPYFTELARRGVCPVCGRDMGSARRLMNHFSGRCGAVIIYELENFVVVKRALREGYDVMVPPPPRTASIEAARRLGIAREEAEALLDPVE